MAVRKNETFTQLVLITALLIGWPIEAVYGQRVPEMFALGNFTLDSGEVLRNAKIAYTTDGVLNEEKSNAILVPSSYSASNNSELGFLVREGAALDPAEYFVIRTNMFANGWSSSPSNTPPPQDGPRFPEIAIRDNVNAAYRLLTEQLGIPHLLAVVGFSMGGQQAYQWAVSYPDYMDGVVVLSGNAREYPFGIVRLEGAKAAIKADAAWQNGEYTVAPEKGIRALGAHWAAWIYSPEWWRRETYLSQGLTLEEAIRRREESFLGNDANDLLSQAVTWQNHNIAETPGQDGNLENTLRSIRTRVLLMPASSDLYFRVTDLRNESRFIRDFSLQPIETVWGHPGAAGADPVANRFINSTIRTFLTMPD
ncbi:MAG: alpha/beta fold hydrolase [Gammaproteobacteria bacterium]|nr:alpha/beta fold hydrolase [Pseudomonadales bacterium]MCP5347147.1 alpha/beta fold hydrolase [Pseudomonadales bacterium]